MSNDKNGYDRYLDFQFDQGGGFFKKLFLAMASADDTNIEKLRLGFPEEVAAFIAWSRVGVEEFIKGVTPDNPLLERLEFES